MFARNALAAALLAAPLFAQTGQLTGLITDPSGTAVPGASVTVTSVETGIKRETVTNDQGYYTVLFLNPGNYGITVRKQGFKALERRLSSSTSRRWPASISRFNSAKWPKA